MYDEKYPSHIKTKVMFEDGDIIGQANAFWISREKGIANIGYHVHPAYQQKGVGYQLTRSLLDDLSNGVRYFAVLTTDDNISSQRLCEKLGFTHAPDEIRDVITNTDKYKKIPGPFLRVWAVNERPSKVFRRITTGKL